MWDEEEVLLAGTTPSLPNYLSLALLFSSLSCSASLRALQQRALGIHPLGHGGTTKPWPAFSTAHSKGERGAGGWLPLPRAAPSLQCQCYQTFNALACCGQAATEERTRRGPASPALGLLVRPCAAWAEG